MSLLLVQLTYKEVDHQWKYILPKDIQLMIAWSKGAIEVLSELAVSN